MDKAEVTKVKGTGKLTITSGKGELVEIINPEVLLIKPKGK